MCTIFRQLGMLCLSSQPGVRATASARLHQRPARPSVLYIVVDDLRVELPMYGQQEIQAPNLVALAQRGVVFDRAYCNQPVCRYECNAPLR